MSNQLCGRQSGGLVDDGRPHGDAGELGQRDGEEPRRFGEDGELGRRHVGGWLFGVPCG